MALGFLATTTRPDVLTVPLPAGLAARLLDAVEHARASAPGERRAALDDVARELRSTPLELTAPRGLLGELALVALDEAGDAVAAATTRLLRGEAGEADVRAAVGELTALLELLARTGG